MNQATLTGQCHCGNLAFELRWSGEPAELALHSCGCSFCGPRGAAWAAAPGTTLELTTRVPAQVSRYTFATHTAVFHVCSRCGAVPVLTSEIDGTLYAAINLRALARSAPAPTTRAADIDLTRETPTARRARRKRDWIPNVRCIGTGLDVRASPRGSFSVSRTILFGECDPGGIVYTPRVADFVAEAAMAFVSARLGTPAARYAFQTGILPPARLLSIEYLQPMAFDEQIEIEVRIDYVGDHSYALALSARKPDQSVAFRARLVQVCVSASTMRPVPVPAQLRAALLGAGATPAQKELGAGGGCADGVT